MRSGLEFIEKFNGMNPNSGVPFTLSTLCDLISKEYGILILTIPEADQATLAENEKISSFIMFADHSDDVDDFVRGKAIIFVRDGINHKYRTFLLARELGHYFFHSSIPLLNAQRDLSQELRNTFDEEATIFSYWCCFPNGYLKQRFDRIDHNSSWQEEIRQIYTDMVRETKQFRRQPMLSDEDRLSIWNRIKLFARSDRADYDTRTSGRCSFVSLPTWCHRLGCNHALTEM